MNGINFPRMFRGASTEVVKDTEATKISLHLLLSSSVNSLFGDPDFGVKIKTFIYDQNNYILRDIVIDEIYTKVATFCPQVYIERKNIIIKQVKNKLYAEIACQNQKDFTLNTYNLILFDLQGEQ